MHESSKRDKRPFVGLRTGFRRLPHFGAMCFFGIRSALKSLQHASGSADARDHAVESLECRNTLSCRERGRFPATFVNSAGEEHVLREGLNKYCR